MGKHLGMRTRKGSLNKDMLIVLLVQDSKAEKDEGEGESKDEEEEEEEEEEELVDPKDTFEEGECIFSLQVSIFEYILRAGITSRI